MVPVARHDVDMMRHFADPKLPSELDATVDAAITKCRNWIIDHISPEYEVFQETPGA